MFFPIALARDDDTHKALADRWLKQYKDTSPYPKLWDWTTANFKKLKVKELPTYVALFIHRGRADLRAGNEREGGHSPTATGTGSAADEL